MEIGYRSAAKKLTMILQRNAILKFVPVLRVRHTFVRMRAEDPV